MPSSSNSQYANVSATLIRGADFSPDLDWRDLFRYRELLYFLTWRDVKVRYKQTVLGVVWAILQPLAIALSLSLFLSRLIKVPPGELPYLVFAYAGMVLWQFFAQSVTEAANSLVVNERLVTKVYFPRLLVPLSSVLASFVDFAVSLVILAVFLAYFHIVPGPSLVVFPFMVILTAVIASGVGFWLSALNVKYRDVRYTLNFLVQLWFLATPIAYPSSAVPERWSFLYALNPMVGVVDGFRWSLHGTGHFPAASLSLSLGVTALLFFSGLSYFRRTEDTFADFI